MATARSQRSLSTDKLLEAARQMTLPELEHTINKLVLLKAQRTIPNRSAAELALLTTINESVLPLGVHQRYRELIKKRQEENLTDEEYAELLQLGDQAEQNQVERLEALAELAHLRGTSVRELMNALGIVPLSVR